jgi:outer membrane protein assembly factor BamB
VHNAGPDEVGTAVALIGTDIYVAGGISSPDPSISLIKYRGNGDTVWSRVLNLDLTEKTVGIAVGSDSAPVVCVAVTDLPPKLSLVKLNKNGDTVWTRHRLGFKPTGVAVDASNEIFVLGSSGGPIASESLALVKYSASGAVAFDYSWQLGTSHATGGCALDASGNLVGALTVNYSGGNHTVLLKFDGLGDTLWSQRYGALNGEEPQGVAVEPNGCIVLADRIGSTLRVVKFTPTGSQLWNNAVPGSDTLHIYANIAVDADSNIAVPASDSQSNGMVCVLDAQGNQQGSLFPYTLCQLRSVAFGSDGLPVAAGMSSSSIQPGGLTVKFSVATAIAEPANPYGQETGDGRRAGRFLVEGILGSGQAIVLTVPRAGSYTISIVTENGALLRQINRGYLTPGEFRFAPGRLAAGSYYLRIAGPTGTFQEKFIQLR